MDTDAAHLGATADLSRGGFWRRWTATLIDTIVILLPFQILFAMTAGMVQMDSGLFGICTTIKTVPQSLHPAPPHDSNFARICRFSLFWRANRRDPDRRTRHARGLRHDERHPRLHAGQGQKANRRHVHRLDGHAGISCLSCRHGLDRTNIGRSNCRRQGHRRRGAWCCGGTDPQSDHPKPGNGNRLCACVRHLELPIPANGGSADAIFTGSFFRWFMSAGLLGAAWVVVLIWRIAAKKNPVYDRLRGRSSSERGRLSFNRRTVPGLL